MPVKAFSDDYWLKSIAHPGSVELSEQAIEDFVVENYAELYPKGLYNYPKVMWPGVKKWWETAYDDAEVARYLTDKWAEGSIFKMRS